MSESLRSRLTTIGLSCLLHVGLVTGLILGQQWVTAAIPMRPPVLPVQLVTLDAPEATRPEPPPPPVQPPRERIKPPRLIEPPRPKETPPAAKIEEPDRPPTPMVSARGPDAPAPTDSGPAAAESVPAPATTIVPSAVSGGPPGPPPPPATALARPSTAAPEGLTQYARPQGGYQVRPTYPSTPRRLGIQGTTLRRVHVLADGRIGDVLVEKSAGHPELDDTATGAVRRWRFEPARRGSEAVAMWVLLPVEFRLR